MAKLLRKDVLKWIRNLKSGAYRKGTGTLVSKSGDEFCCLGVWADQRGAVWEEVETWDGHLIPLLPTKKKYMRQNQCTLQDPKLACGLSIKIQSELAEINDESAGFRKVIKYIEEYVLPLAK